MSNQALQKKIDDGLQDHPSWVGRHTTINHLLPGIHSTVAAHPELAPRLVEIKEEAIDHLDALLEQTVASMERNGFHVYIADTATDAVEYIANLVGDRLVVKSKSNTGKEIGVTKRLQQGGATVYETDLGDRLAQLEGKGKSAHPLAPACHLTRVECAQLLSKDAGEELPTDPELLVGVARRTLRDAFLRADVGISGANSIAADTGAIFLTENEGNIRNVTSIPRTHIIVAGIEKIVPHFVDGLTVVRTASSYACGQDIGTYVSVIDGASCYSHPAMDFLSRGQGPTDIHVVFLRQGRRKAIDEGYKSVLYCLNCGGCLNVCPVYSAIGDQYGYKYLGGRGAVFAAFHSDDPGVLDEAGLSLCIGCQRCLTACPLEMPVPQMILQLRAEKAQNEGNGVVKDTVFRMLGAGALPALTKVGRRFQGAALKEQPQHDAVLRFDAAKLGVAGMPKDRLLPTLAKPSFPELAAKRSPLGRPKGKVGFFAGCLVNYAYPQLGVDCCDVLMANQIQPVTFAGEACCGLPAIMSGDLDDARKMAIENIRLLSAAEYDHLVFVCPSCATTVKEEWGKLLADCDDPQLLAQYAAIRDKAMELSDYLVNVLDIRPPQLKTPVNVTWHDPCHLARGLHVTEEPRKLLRALGADLTEMETPDSCCGFGGSFSLFHYDVSRSVNDEKIQQIADTGAQYAVTGCPGCVMHLKDGLYRNHSQQQAIHLVSLLAQAYRQEGDAQWAAINQSTMIR